MYVYKQQAHWLIQYGWELENGVAGFRIQESNSIRKRRRYHPAMPTTGTWLFQRRLVRLVTDVENYHASQYGKAYLLQQYSKEWQEFVDVIDVDDKDHLKPAPILTMSPIKVHVINLS